MVDVDKLIRDLQDKDYEPHSFTDDQKLSSAIMDAQALEIRRLQELIEEYEVSEAMYRSKLTQCKKKIMTIATAKTLQDERHAIVDAEKLVAVMDRERYDSDKI